MSNAGQAILSVGGAAIGFFVGGPAGAAWGFQLGGLAGSALFPTDLGTISGPRLTDLNVQSSAVGAPIPIVYGTYAIAGNVIWSSGIIEEVTKKKQGGKGGPTQTVKTYTYSVNCAVGVCEGEIAGIRRIWADAKLIYDARPQLEGETTEEYDARAAAATDLLTRTEIYLGSASQLADPTIESFEGAGNVGGFRDLAYVVFSEFQLADYGNRIPNFRFEVAGAATLTQVDEVAAPMIHPWLNNALDPRNPLNGHEYRIKNGIAQADFYTYEETWDTFYAFHNASGAGRNNNPLINTILCWSLRDGDNQMEPVGPIDFANTYEAEELHLWFGPGVVTTFHAKVNAVDGTVANIIPDLTYNTLEYHSGTYVASTGHGQYYWGDVGSQPSYNEPAIALNGPANAFPYWLQPGETIYGWNDESFTVRRTPSPPEGEGWELVSGTARALSVYSEVNGVGYQYRDTYIVNALHTYKHLYRPNGLAKVPTNAEYDDEAFWTAAYDEAVVDDRMPSGWTYGNQYPVTISEYYLRTLDVTLVDPGEATLGGIVRDICERCGLTVEQIDVSDLTEMVDGYVISRVMNGRDAISPLRSFGWFDCVESAGVLKWPKRGQASVFTLTADDLAAHTTGDQRPPAVETRRQQEVELPRRLRVHYAQAGNNYEPGEQGASRLAAGHIEVTDIEVAVSMSDTKAARIAEVVLYDLWVSRNKHRVTVSTAWLDVEPGDAGTMPIDGRQERVRVVSSTLTLPGLLALELVRDDDGSYVSFALGAPAAAPGPGSSISIIGISDFVPLDLPLLRDADNDAGYYGAIQAIDATTFGGAVLFRSPDGITFEEVSTASTEATIGEVVDALPAGPTTIIDEGNELLVSGLEATALESIAHASLLAGLNAAAIGDDGRWEVIQFRDAALVGSPAVWRLTGLVRGRRGTEWAVGTSQIGDRFVLLDSALIRVPMNIAGIGATREHRGVLVGANLEATPGVNFAGLGVALEPFSPVHVEGAWSGNDFEITWIRRGRIGQELPSGTDIPLSEASEAYEVDVLDGVTVVRTLSSSATTVTYLEAQIAADFGSPAPLNFTVRVYQLSAVVGRGYPIEVTI